MAWTGATPTTVAGLALILGAVSPCLGQEVETWTLPAEPRVDIGVVSGEEAYQLHGAESSTLLADGRIVVLNGGSGQVRIFDAQGRFVRQFGAEGQGPGEFLLATRIARTGDGVRVWDQRQRRFTSFDLEGTLGEMETLRSDPAEPFPLDVWLYERNLVDSPVRPEVRGTLATGLDALPTVADDVAARYVLVTEEGHMWTSDVVPPAESAVRWTVHDLDGSLRARVTTPARFRPHEIGADYVLGLWLDPLDVNHIRLYDLQRPPGSAAGPGLDAVRRSGRPLRPTASREVPDDVLPLVKSSLKFLASAQEIHYSQHGTYTRDLSDADLDLPEELRVDFIEAHPMGWTGFVTHRPTGVFCVLTYGFTSPMGWDNGRVICPGY